MYTNGVVTDRVSVFSFCRLLPLLFVISFPGSTDNIGMNCVVFFYRQLLYVGKLHINPKTEHTRVPVSAGQNNRVPFFVDSRRSISQVGNGSVLCPRSASVEPGRVAPAA